MRMASSKKSVMKETQSWKNVKKVERKIEMTILICVTDLERSI